MKLSLSTNWCNRRLERGEEIADKAIELGFSELELGFHTTLQQVEGFRSRLAQIPVGSVHAFCPVPLSAPQGYPELYQLASFDPEMTRLATFHVTRNVEFAASMGADTVVLHAGRVLCDSWFARWRVRRRAVRGQRMLEAFRPTLEALIPVLEKHKVTLALENLPYYEGFPNETELDEILKWDLGGWVKGWFDTGHHRVRQQRGWLLSTDNRQPSTDGHYAGMHLNDVVDASDDHLAPGFGKVDFPALKSLAESVRHVVFEPAPSVSEDDLKQGIAHVKTIWEV